MTQYRFTSNEKDVITGWDVPLQYYFLTIKGDKLLFSNLELEDPSMTIASIVEKCGEFGIQVPEDIVQKLNQDCVHSR